MAHSRNDKTTPAVENTSKAEEKEHAVSVAGSLVIDTASEMIIKANTQNTDFCELVKNSGIDKDCNPLIAFGEKTNIDTATMRFLKSCGYTPKTFVPAITIAPDEEGSDIYKTLTEYLVCHYQNFEQVNKVEIVNPRHLIIRVLRDMIIKIERFNRDKPEIVGKLRVVVILCHAIKRRDWPNQTISKMFSLEKNEETAIFRNHIDQLIKILNDRIRECEMRNEKKIMEDSLNKIESDLRTIIDCINTVNLCATNSEKDVPLDTFSKHSASLAELNNIIPVAEMVRLSPKQLEAKNNEHYARFKNNKAIPDKVKKLIDSPEKLFMTKVLFNMQAAETSLARIENAAVSQKVMELKTKAESAKNNMSEYSLASDNRATIMPESKSDQIGADASYSLTPARSNSNTTAVVAAANLNKEKAKQEYRLIMTQRKAYINALEVMLPAECQDILKSKSAKYGAARDALEEYVKILKELFEIKAILVLLHRSVKHTQIIVSGLAEMAKFANMPAMEALIKEGRDKLKKAYALLELYWEVNSNYAKYVKLSEQQNINVQIGSEKARTALDIITGSTLPAFSAFQNCLSPDVIRKNMLDIQGAFEGMSECLNVLSGGAVIEVSPFKGLVDAATVWSIMASDAHKANLKAINHGQHFKQLMQPNAAVPVGALLPAGEQVMKMLPPVNLETEITLKEILNLELPNRKGLILDEILHYAKIVRNVDGKFFLHFDDADVFPIEKEAADWLQNNPKKLQAQQIEVLERLDQRNNTGAELSDIVNRELIIEALQKKSNYQARLNQIKLELPQYDRSKDFSVRMSVFKPNLLWIFIVTIPVHFTLYLGALLYLKAKKSVYANAKQKLESLQREEKDLNAKIAECDEQVVNARKAIAERDLEKAEFVRRTEEEKKQAIQVLAPDKQAKQVTQVEQIEEAKQPSKKVKVVKAPKEVVINAPVAPEPVSSVKIEVLSEDSEQKGDLYDDASYPESANESEQVSEEEQLTSSNNESKEENEEAISISQPGFVSSTRILNSQMQAAQVSQSSAISSSAVSVEPAEPKTSSMVQNDLAILEHENIKRMVELFCGLDEKLSKSEAPPKRSLLEDRLELRFPELLQKIAPNIEIQPRIREQALNLACACLLEKVNDCVNKMLVLDDKHQFIKLLKICNEDTKKARKSEVEGKAFSAKDSEIAKERRQKMLNNFNVSYRSAQEALAKEAAGQGLSYEFMANFYIKGCIFELVNKRAIDFKIPSTQTSQMLSKLGNKLFGNNNNKPKKPAQTPPPAAVNTPASRSATPTQP